MSGELVMEPVCSAQAAAAPDDWDGGGPRTAALDGRTVGLGASGASGAAAAEAGEAWTWAPPVAPLPPSGNGAPPTCSVTKCWTSSDSRCCRASLLRRRSLMRDRRASSVWLEALSKCVPGTGGPPTLGTDPAKRANAAGIEKRASKLVGSLC